MLVKWLHIVYFREKDEGSKEIIQVNQDTLSIENVKVR